MLTRSAYVHRKRAIEEQTIVTEEVCRLPDQCAICMSDLAESPVYHTPCGHTFHTGCFERQIGEMQGDNRTRCAMCRMELSQNIYANDTLSNIPPPLIVMHIHPAIMMFAFMSMEVYEDENQFNLDNIDFSSEDEMDMEMDETDSVS